MSGAWRGAGRSAPEAPEGQRGGGRRGGRRRARGGGGRCGARPRPPPPRSAAAPRASPSRPAPLRRRCRPPTLRLPPRNSASADVRRLPTAAPPCPSPRPPRPPRHPANSLPLTPASTTPTASPIHPAVGNPQPPPRPSSSSSPDCTAGPSLGAECFGGGCEGSEAAAPESSAAPGSCSAESSTTALMDSSAGSCRCSASTTCRAPVSASLPSPSSPETHKSQRQPFVRPVRCLPGPSLPGTAVAALYTPGTTYRGGIVPGAWQPGSSLRSGASRCQASRGWRSSRLATLASILLQM